MIAEDHLYCGKEVKRKLDAGPVDHDVDAKVRVYENGKVAADENLLQRITKPQLSERAIAKGQTSIANLSTCFAAVSMFDVRQRSRLLNSLLNGGTKKAALMIWESESPLVFLYNEKTLCNPITALACGWKLKKEFRPS